MNQTTTIRTTLEELSGKRAFLEYRKADGTLTERTVKVIRTRDEKVTVWDEGRGGLRSLLLRGVLSVHPLTSATKKVTA